MVARTCRYNPHRYACIYLATHRIEKIGKIKIRHIYSDLSYFGSPLINRSHPQLEELLNRGLLPLIAMYHRVTSTEDTRLYRVGLFNTRTGQLRLAEAPDPTGGGRFAVWKNVLVVYGPKSGPEPLKDQARIAGYDLKTLKKLWEYSSPEKIKMRKYKLPAKDKLLWPRVAGRFAVIPQTRTEDSIVIDIQTGKRIQARAFAWPPTHCRVTYDTGANPDALLSLEDLKGLEKFEDLKEWAKRRPTAEGGGIGIVGRLAGSGNYIGHKGTRNYIIDGQNGAILRRFDCEFAVVDVTGKYIICENREDTTYIFDRRKFLEALGFDYDGHRLKDALDHLVVSATQNMQNPRRIAKVEKGARVSVKQVRGLWCGGAPKEDMYCDWNGYPDRHANWMVLHAAIGASSFRGEGDHLSFTAPESGLLKLYCDDDNPRDNSGAVVVKVKIAHHINRKLTGHTNVVRDVCVSGDGALAVSAAEDGTLRIWDLARSKTKAVIETTSGINACALSTDKQYIYSAGKDRSVHIWNLATGKEIAKLSGHRKSILDIALSPDGTRLASTGLDRTLILWDLAKRTIIRRFQGHARGVRAVAFSPDGKLLASGGLDHSVRVWDSPTGKLLKNMLGHRFSIRTVIFSRDGKQVISGGDDLTVRVWDVESGRELKCLRGHESLVTGLALAKDGRTLLSCDLDGSVIVWDLLKGEETEHIRTNNPGFHAISLLPDGTQGLGAGRDGMLYLVNLEPQD